MNNPFENFDQRELEILQQALMNIDVQGDFLPQHRERCKEVYCRLWKQLREVVRAPAHSNDGSHFGEKWVGES